MDTDILINTLLDHKFITYDGKRTVARELGILTNDVIGFELIMDEVGVNHTLLIYISNQAHLKKECFDKFDYKEIYYDECIVVVV